MRIDIHPINLTLAKELTQYAETRMWQATRRASRRVTWIGVWLTNDPGDDGEARFSCRLDAWVRGVGIITIRHFDSNAGGAIDIAAGRLEQAIAGKVRRLAQRPLRPIEANARRHGFFEHQIAKAIVLALFVPLIISSGGNAGSQAATLVIRSLALGELRLTDWLRVLGRELQSGLALGF